MLADLCKVLSHPVRLQLLKILATRGDCICGDVLSVGSFSEATILHHLKALQQVGLIQGNLEGAKRCYQVNSHTLQLFKDLVESL
ncbi:MAG: winged helix-turn-helix transcriptional regulator [Leptolyngbya sp. SIO1D8]|nr:winged helix-turn-helix transcriptional regulator [Leptolyngbya sp. SIO1D8]